MSEESDNEDGTKTRHSPKWRSERTFYAQLFALYNVFFK